MTYREKEVIMFTSIFNDFDDVFKSVVKSGDFTEVFPPSNVYTNEDGCVIELALAGYKKENVSIERVGADEIKISVKAKEEEENNKKTYYNHRIKTSAFERSYKIPLKNYDISKISAKMEDGILRVTIPRAKQEEPQNFLINID